MLYKDTLREWCPWFFLMDHPNYTRWVSVHVMDMDNLEKANPDVYEEFNTEGRFTVSVSGRPFSTIGLDQNHEQLNAKLKDDWDNTGSLGDKLKKLLVSGPEISRLLDDFEEKEDIIIREFHHSADVASQKGLPKM